MKNELKLDTVDKKHFIYSLVIACLLIVFIAAFYYGGDDKAGSMLSFAATFSSILLACIAIVMTTVDLAGQRNTVADLKETAEKLKQNLIETTQAIDEVTKLKTELIHSMNVLQEHNKVIAKEISELKAKYNNTSIDKDQLSAAEFLKDLENLGKKVYEPVKLEAPQILNDRILQIRKENVLTHVIKNNFKNGHLYEFNTIWETVLQEPLPVSRSELKNMLNKMVNRGQIERVEERFYKPSFS